MQIFMRAVGWLGVTAVIGLLAPVPAVLADSGANHQDANMHFGVSGGNVKDRSAAFCCSGTLGALVQDATGILYVLSNNHVLARSDQAALGEHIAQPGLIDNACQIPANGIVADLTVAPKLGSNVDAAIAQLRDGAMDKDGFIEDIGLISGVVKPPAIGLAVAKSGRTTGFTTGTIGSINTSVSVQYQRGCGQGKKFTVRYTNQVVINSSTFSAGGDSGSLIVTNDQCHQPVALLFAGSSSATIANPISEVLSKVGARLESTVSFVGNTCSTTTALQSLDSGAAALASPSGALGGGLAQAAVEHATAIMQQHVETLMALPGIVGVGVGASDANPAEAVITIYVDQTTGRLPRLPHHLQGVQVKIIASDPFIAYLETISISDEPCSSPHPN
jgi:hypothetical protein